MSLPHGEKRHLATTAQPSSLQVLCESMIESENVFCKRAEGVQPYPTFRELTLITSAPQIYQEMLPSAQIPSGFSEQRNPNRSYPNCRKLGRTSCQERSTQPNIQRNHPYTEENCGGIKYPQTQSNKSHRQEKSHFKMIQISTDSISYCDIYSRTTPVEAVRTSLGCNNKPCDEIECGHKAVAFHR